jgi:hypothetical protein
MMADWLVYSALVQQEIQENTHVPYSFPSSAVQLQVFLRGGRALALQLVNLPHLENGAPIAHRGFDRKLSQAYLSANTATILWFCNSTTNARRLLTWRGYTLQVVPVLPPTDV